VPGPQGERGLPGLVGARGLTGAKGEQGPKGDPGIGRVYAVEGEVVRPETESFFTATAICEAGDLAVGGGFRTIELGDAAPGIITSATFSGNDWTIEGQTGERPVGPLVAQVTCVDLTP
jgi:hypothetical protein